RIAARQMADVETRASDDREPWVIARDAAVISLMYGCGLRIAEALSLTRAEAPLVPGALTVTGKGGKTRQVPVIARVARAVEDYVGRRTWALRPRGALFVGAKGGPLHPRIVQRAMQDMRSALGLPDTATPHALRH